MQYIEGKQIMRLWYHFSKGIMRAYIHVLDVCICVHVYTPQEHICATHIKLQVCTVD